MACPFYDSENRLTAMSGFPGASLGYYPDGSLWQTVGSATTQFLYDGDQIIGEYSSPGNVLRRYVPGPAIDEPLVWYEGSGLTNRRWLLADHQGSVIAWADTSGAIPNANIDTYDEYGNPGSSNTGRFQYTGQAWIPEIAAYDYRARNYMPSIGRFLQTDPKGYDGGLNLYGYADGDPVDSEDPTGLDPSDPGDNARSQPAPWIGQCPYHICRGDEGQWPNSGCDQAGSGYSDTCPGESNPSGCDFRCQQAKFKAETEKVADDPLLKYPATVIEWLIPGDAELSIGSKIGSKLIDDAEDVLENVHCCFVSGTLVATKDGLQPIEKIKVGELVLSRDPDTGATAYKPVVSIVPRHERDIYLLKVHEHEADGSDRVETFRTTADHPWRTIDGQWATTDELRAGEAIQTAYGSAVNVASAFDTHRVAPTYNLEVADFHTYFVGEGRLWVHNECTPGQLAKYTRQLAVAGRESLLKSQASLERRLAEHEAKLAKYLSEGGYTSSVEKEIRNCKGELDAIRRVLGQ